MLARSLSTAVALASVVVSLSVVGAAATGVAGGRTLSIGYPNAGKLVNGRRLRETPTLRFVPAHAKSPARYGVPALLALLDHASRRVARRYPGAVLGLGELSAEHGGRLAAHHSHQSGRDVDVGFYLVRERGGRGLYPPRFLACDGDGKVKSEPGLRFDEGRNWTLLTALLDDRTAQVRSIFVYAPLRARLLAHAEKVGAPRELRDRAAMLMSQPPHAAPHDDHFHVRIACPPGQGALGCFDDSRARGVDGAGGLPVARPAAAPAGSAHASDALPRLPPHDASDEPPPAGGDDGDDPNDDTTPE